MLPQSPYLKDVFEKFEQGQPCFEDRMQKLNSDFAKICISPKPTGFPMGKVSLQVLKELEFQARQNVCNINFVATH